MDKESIKKALKDHSIEKLKYQDGIKIKEIDFADILTLINELESENELLKVENERFENNMRAVLKIEKKQAVKDFAEKLKNKLFEFFQDNEELDGKISVGPLYVDVIGVEAKDGTIISLGLIDELLKEYEK